MSTSKSYEITPGVKINVEPSHLWLARIADLPKSPIAEKVEKQLSEELLLDKTTSHFSERFVDVTHKYGFAVVHDPSIEEKLFTDTYEVLAKLFASKEEYLSRFGRPGPGNEDGYIPPATEISTSVTGTAVANVFQFIHRVVDSEQNQQIDDSLGKEFKEKSDKIISVLYQQVRDVAIAMAKGLKGKGFLAPDGGSIHPNYFVDLMESLSGAPSGLSLARLTHCRAQRTDQKNFAGCSMAHTDLNFITALPRPTSPLQLWYTDKENSKNSGYVELNAPPGSFTLNIGDQAEILTGGYLSSTPHRVIAPIGEDRYSIILFGGLNRETNLLDKKLTHPTIGVSRFEIESLPRIGEQSLTAECFTELRKMDIGLTSAEAGKKMGFKPLHSA